MSLDFYRHLIETSATRIEDTWHRREAVARYVHTFHILGYPFTLRTNSEQVIALADISERRFSTCPPLGDAHTGEIDLFVSGDGPDEPLPLMQLEKQFTTVAHGERGIMHLGRWGAISANWSRP